MRGGPGGDKPPPLAPALTWEGVAVPGDAVCSQEGCGGGHQHPHHRRARHRWVGLKGRLSWKRAAAC